MKIKKQDIKKYAPCLHEGNVSDFLVKKSSKDTEKCSPENDSSEQNTCSISLS